MRKFRALIIPLGFLLLGLLYSCTFQSSNQVVQRYHPLSLDKWKLNKIPLNILSMAVISASNPDQNKKFMFGNGVLIHSSKENGALVLTCAHLIDRKEQQQGSIQVGLFRHSYLKPLRNIPEYQEFIAQEIARDDDLDLAIVKFHPLNLIHTAPLLISTHEQINAQYLPRARGKKISIVSIVPYGCARVKKCLDIHHAKIIKGQSGSGLFYRNGLTGLVRGTLGHNMGISIGSEKIISWLEKIDMRSKVIQRRFP